MALSHLCIQLTAMSWTKERLHLNRAWMKGNISTVDSYSPVPGVYTWKLSHQFECFFWNVDYLKYITYHNKHLVLVLEGLKWRVRSDFTLCRFFRLMGPNTDITMFKPRAYCAERHRPNQDSKYDTDERLHPPEDYMDPWKQTTYWNWIGSLILLVQLSCIL